MAASKQFHTDPTTVKLCLLGATGVGKRRLIFRWTDDDKHQSAEIRSKQYRIDDEVVRLEFSRHWHHPIARQVPILFRNTAVCIACYSGDVEGSLEEALSTLNQAKQFVHEETIFALAFLKNDLPAEVQMATAAQGKQIAEENSYAFFECSSQTRENIVESLEFLVRLALPTAKKLQNKDRIRLDAVAPDERSTWPECC